jgi:eukaryotic-like serine/threonine-protein kinase
MCGHVEGPFMRPSEREDDLGATASLTAATGNWDQGTGPVAATPPEAESKPPDRSVAGRRQLFAVDGATSAEGELRGLLRRRLWYYSGLSAVAHMLVLVLAPTGLADYAQPRVFGWLGMTLLVLADLAPISVLVWLGLRPNLNLPALRRGEGLVIGMTTLFVAVWQYQALVSRAAGGFEGLGHERSYILGASFCLDLIWVLDMLAYGTLIPNPLGRCARIIGAMGLLHVGVDLLAGATNAGVGRNLFLAVYVSIAAMSITSGIALFGVYRVAALQEEAARARREVRELGQYRLKQKLGSGGMGEVYLAEHRLLKRPCALKLIRPELSANPTNLARFAREVQAMSDLSHPNTVEVYDYGRGDDGTFYYVMEYLPGPTLDRLVRRHGPLPCGRAIYLLRQVCLALREAHGLGMVHRDLKPGNIIVTCQGGLHDVAKLLDFGLVQDLATTTTDGRLTEAGLIMGTPEYLSPEQASGDSALDPRSDIYSLGAVAYFALSGGPVFAGRSVGRLIAAHLTEPPPPLAEARPDIPDDLAAIVHRCLAKARDDRFPDVAALQRALSACACATEWSEDSAADWWRSQVLDADDPDRTPTEEPVDVSGPGATTDHRSP